MEFPLAVSIGLVSVYMDYELSEYVNPSSILCESFSISIRPLDAAHFRPIAQDSEGFWLWHLVTSLILCIAVYFDVQHLN